MLHFSLTALVLATLCCGQLNAQGLAHVDTRLLRLRADTMRITRIAEHHEIPGGWAVSTLEATTSDKLVLRYTYAPPGNPPVVTITSLKRGSLQPIDEIHDYGSGDTVIVHYGAGGAHAERRRGGAAEWFAPDPAALNVFSSAAVDLVFRTLPLRAGYRVELPVYFAALNRTERIPVRVRDSEMVKTRGSVAVDCWLVEAVFPGGAAEQFWVAKQTRDLIRVLGHVTPDTLERYDR